MPFISLSQHNLDPVDLESLDHSVVTHVQQLEIPCGFAQAYNPSWVRFQGEIITAVRCDNYGATPGSTTIGIYDRSTTPHWLAIPQPLPEDPRLIVFQERLWLFFNGRAKDAHMKLFLCPLEKHLGRWRVARKPVELIWPESPKRRTEKNWMPLVKDGELFLIYDLQPYTLLKANVETGICTRIETPSPAFSWHLGAPRGSTQMLPHPDGGYVGIFHSSKRTTPLRFRPRTKVYYFIGGMKIDANLHLTHVSKSAYFIPGFYNQGGNGRVVFPCGILDDEESYRLCAGKNDDISLEITLDKRAFMESLQELSQSTCAN